MTFYICLDERGGMIARCQTDAEVELLRRRGQRIASVQPMAPQDAVVCRLSSRSLELEDEL